MENESPEEVSESEAIAMALLVLFGKLIGVIFEIFIETLVLMLSSESDCNDPFGDTFFDHGPINNDDVAEDIFFWEKTGDNKERVTWFLG